MVDTNGVHLNALAEPAAINRYAELLNSVILRNQDGTVSGDASAAAGTINPEFFYSKQLLDTIRIDAAQFVYFRLADEAPIQEKADKLMLRRWAPLRAHTVPLQEGVPPTSDKGSVEKYEIPADSYGRYMEFSDKVNFKVVDPIVTHYTREYNIVAMETLDLLARETLLAIANQKFAGAAVNFEGLTIASKPSMTDLRMIVLGMKKALVKPRMNGRFQVIASPEFYYDMISDPIVEKYMTINQSTKTMYDNGQLVPMFEMEFYETLCVPTSGEFSKGGNDVLRVFRLEEIMDGETGTGEYEYVYRSLKKAAASKATANADGTYDCKFTDVAGYDLDSRTGKNASYMPAGANGKWDLDDFNDTATATANPWVEFKAQHVLVVGKDALTRTGLTGEGQAKMYVKPLGSAGVLDPIDQRQSIGFKINSVGFGSTRLEAVEDYICVPSQVN